MLNTDAEKRALERANAALATITANREALVVERTVNWVLRAGWLVVTHPGYEHGHDIEATRSCGVLSLAPAQFPHNFEVVFFSLDD